MASVTSVSRSGTNDDNVIFSAGQSEVDRLDMQHKVIYASMPQLVQAPIDLKKGGLRILDQATGSGLWIRDVRETAGGDNNWVGTDIEDSYFPKAPPADTTYHHQSMTESWPADWSNSFDLVHSRFALPGVGMNPLEYAVKNLIGLVKPGGWIQMVELEWGNWNAGPEGKVFHDSFREMLTMVTNGQGVDLHEKLIPIFKNSGLENLRSKSIDVGYGAVANEEIRDVSEASLLATVKGGIQTMKMLPPISISPEILEALPERLAKENRERGFEMKVFALWAQKPLDM
ncbi:hypothetical protein BCR34DRAFT_519118 [Clohesyomyces aquaticus]|uniref:Methyltransferase domain-containing protein n=1 Tax=Clohesyomyces aquaticus TaxID=1231657 RepID=A0A1Y1Z756_9PLEO|nr:hypothetical protein BCR34DRAFT_519118 [Clohesyomyces aquaticus]